MKIQIRHICPNKINFVKLIQNYFHAHKYIFRSLVHCQKNDDEVIKIDKEINFILLSNNTKCLFLKYSLL